MKSALFTSALAGLFGGKLFLAAGVVAGVSVPPIGDGPFAPTVSPIAFAYTDTSATDTFAAYNFTITAPGATSFGITGGTGTTTITKVGSYGTVTLTAATGVGVYTPNNAAMNAVESGSPTDVFTVTATNSGTGLTGSAALTVTVNGAAEAAVVYARLSAALSAVAAGTGRAIIACVGDSLNAGWGAGIASGPGTGSAGSATNAKRATSLPQQMAALWAASGIPTRSDAFFGALTANNTTAEYTGYNPAVVLGSGWSLPTALSVGGRAFGTTSSATGALDYTPTIAANSFDIYYIRAGGNGTLTVADASGTLGSVSSNGADSLQKLSITRAASSTLPISITRTTAGSIFIVGIVPFDTTSPRLEIWNMGWAGSKVSDWTATASGWNAYNGLPLFAPDLWTLELGANDSAVAVPSATYQSGLQTLTTRLKSIGGDVALIKCHKANPTSNSQNLSAAYLAAIDAITTASNLQPAIDFNVLTLATTERFDSIHLTSTGYAREAAVAYSVLRSRV